MAAKKTTSKKKHSAVPPQATAKPKAAEAVAATPAPAAVAVAKAPEAAKPATTAAATAVAEQPKPATTPVVAAAPAAVPVVDLSALVAALRGSDADAAREAAVELGRTKSAAAVDALAAALANADGYFHSVVRAAAAAALGEIGDARAVPALLAGVRDEMAEASAEAVRGLAAIGDAAAVPALVEVVENRHGFFLPVVRRAAVLALVKLGGPDAAAAVSAVAANTYEDNSVREAAGRNNG